MQDATTGHTQITTAYDSPLCAALAYAEMGWPVLPNYTIRDGACTCNGKRQCHPGKHPRRQRGFNGASTDTARIRRWWKEVPDANVGVRTGEPSGLVVIDVDPDKGGHEALDELQGEFGELPSGPIARTGGGGWRLLFRHPGTRVSSTTSIRPGIDIRADGAQIIMAPSVHISGGVYAWEVSPDEVDLPELPESWRDLVFSRPPTVSRNLTQGTQGAQGSWFLRGARYSGHGGGRKGSLRRARGRGYRSTRNSNHGDRPRPPAPRIWEPA